LIKLRLTFLVDFSASNSFLIGSKVNGEINWFNWGKLIVGGFLVTVSANIINQIKEVEFDLLMKRTYLRPLPSGRLSTNEAWSMCFVAGVIGTVIMWNVGPLAALLTLVSNILYAFVYTPLKRVGPIAVFVGAIPGAMPPLIGIAAATGTINMEAMILFGFQFIWQFPHFWAIAWVADDDYKKAGFRLLPSGGGKDMKTAIQIMIYALFLIPLGLLPAKFGMTGINSAIIITVCGVLFLMQTFYLMKECTVKSAKLMMFGSFFYLPIVQIALVFDKV
ncbi:MAG: heme o synthase, partial [Cytophagales bacterium]|nr:heme o synthase [Cytophagales bacterium]